MSELNQISTKNIIMLHKIHRVCWFSRIHIKHLRHKKFVKCNYNFVTRNNIDSRSKWFLSNDILSILNLMTQLNISTFGDRIQEIMINKIIPTINTNQRKIFQNIYVEIMRKEDCCLLCFYFHNWTILNNFMNKSWKKVQKTFSIDFYSEFFRRVMFKYCIQIHNLK